MNYSFFYKDKYDSLEDLRDVKFDLFLSAFNNSDRVNKVFSVINATAKHWIILPEYDFGQIEIPHGDDFCVFQYDRSLDEGTLIRDYFDKNSDFFYSKKVCVDITGFLRPHVIFLVRFLALKKIKTVYFLYSDPESYADKEDTGFTDGYIDVKQVIGCEGVHVPDILNDMLIIGAGYDDKRIADVSKSKSKTKKVQVFGFPSLQPDMFQENLINAYKAEESGPNNNQSFLDVNSTILAPANDPFVTAQLISEFVAKEKKERGISNLYLSPLSTKAQTLGFALFYIYECLGEAVSIIFPYCQYYTKESTVGVAKIWIYKVEFPN